MEADLAPLERAGLSPSFDQLDAFDRASRHRLDYSQLLGAFEESARLDPRYFCCSLEAQQALAELIDDVGGLSLWQRHVFCQAPLEPTDALHATSVTRWAGELAAGDEVRLRIVPPHRPPRSHGELQTLESYFKLLDAYLWLAPRFPQSFTHELAEEVRQRQADCSGLISAGLESLGAHDERAFEHGVVAPARQLAKVLAAVRGGRKGSKGYANKGKGS